MTWALLIIHFLSFLNTLVKEVEISPTVELRFGSCHCLEARFVFSLVSIRSYEQGSSAPERKKPSGHF